MSEGLCQVGVKHEVVLAELNVPQGQVAFASREVTKGHIQAEVFCNVPSDIDVNLVAQVGGGSIAEIPTGRAATRSNPCGNHGIHVGLCQRGQVVVQHVADDVVHLIGDGVAVRVGGRRSGLRGGGGRLFPEIWGVVQW